MRRRDFVRLIASSALLLLLAAPVHADCFSSCLGSECSGVNYGNGIGCKLRSNMCMNQCRNGGGSGGASYGAIAYSPKDGDYGYSYGYASRAEAEKSAMNECGKSDCEIAAWYSDKCGALSVGEDGMWAGGTGNTERAAGADAQSDCVKYGGKKCEVLISQCSR